MRLISPRLTVRRLMVLVALLGALLGGGVEAGRLHRLSRAATERADGIQARAVGRYERGAQRARSEWEVERREVLRWNREMHATGKSMMQLGSPPPPEVCRILADHYRALEAKYRRAARFPWLAVEPDRPAPHPAWTEPE